MEYIKQNNHINWLTLLRAINIVLVVMFHIQLIDMNTGNNHLFCSDVTYPFNPIRMPLFIFLSGGLLYLSRIKNEWTTLSLYKDKLKRIMLPFVFFVTFYFLFKASLNSIVKTPIDISFSYYIESFYIFYQHPSAPLWFLATLMTLMLFYPAFRYACRNILFMLFLLILSSLAYFYDFGSIFNNNFFNLANLNYYFIYFYFGIVFFRYSLYQYLNKLSVSVFLILLYSILYYFGVDMIMSIVGIMAMVSVVMNISKYVKIDISYIGNHIYQIYLMSFVFQAFVELVLWKRLFYNEDLFFVFYLLNLCFGLFMPLLVTKCVEKCPYKIIRLCFGLK